MKHDKKLLAQIHKIRNAAFSRKVCMHPNAPGECSGPIIRSHSIQRNINLTRIAPHGHVLQFQADLWTLEKTGDIAIDLVGVKEATTFNGFCSHHDDSTFAPIEKRGYNGDIGQAVLLGYRSLVKEKYAKQSHIEMVKGILKVLPQRPDESFEEAYATLMLKASSHANYLGIVEIDRQLIKYFGAMKTTNFSEFCSVIVHASGEPGFLVATAINPEHDFTGKRLQTITDLKAPLQTISVATQCTDAGVDIIFAWHKNSHTVAAYFLDSLLSLPADRVSDAIVRMLFEYSDNIAISPTWWDSLSSGQQESLKNRMKSHTSMGEKLSGQELVDDGITFGAFNIVSIDKSY